MIISSRISHWIQLVSDYPQGKVGRKKLNSAAMIKVYPHVTISQARDWWFSCHVTEFEYLKKRSIIHSRHVV